jgi:hypothetical protein
MRSEKVKSIVLVTGLSLCQCDATRTATLRPCTV